jgi:hypothetical protein
MIRATSSLAKYSVPPTQVLSANLTTKITVQTVGFVAVSLA